MTDPAEVVRPNGQVDDDMGLFNWFMDSDRVFVKVADEIVINRVAYHGNAHVRLKDGVWGAIYGDIYLRRVGDIMTDPTMAAWNAFRRKVDDIAVSVATHENRRLGGGNGRDLDRRLVVPESA